MRSALLSACVLGVCMSLFDFGGLSKKLKNQIKQISSLVLIIIFASALLSFDADELMFTAKQDLSSDNSLQVMSDAVLENTEDRLEDYLLSSLSNDGINPLKVSIQLTVNKDNLVEISLTEIVLRSTDKEKTAHTRQLVSELLPQGELDVYWED